MLMPSIFGENLFDDDWMDFPFERDFWGRKNPLYGKNAKNIMKTMKTDIREHDEGYELDIDLPGFKKDEITIDLDNGYLTISAAKGLDKDEQDKKGKYIRKERYAGAVQRSFYVGDAVTEEDVKAKFEDGILRLSIPKKDAKAVETKKTIARKGIKHKRVRYESTGLFYFIRNFEFWDGKDPLFIEYILNQENESSLRKSPYPESYPHSDGK